MCRCIICIFNEILSILYLERTKTKITRRTRGGGTRNPGRSGVDQQTEEKKISLK
jgi:hypothetical protein